MAEKSISQLDAAATLSSADLLEVSVVDTSTTSGYASKKATVDDLRATRELTKAEYDALTEAEKMNGTNYFISDWNVSPAIAPVIYSEEEREIGVWTDGKPLYQKTIDCGALPDSSLKNVAHNISNLDKICKIEGILRIGNTAANTVPFFGTGQLETGSTSVVVAVSGDDIVLTTYRDRSSWNAFITLQYTKTTDTAGSGTWTPQGVLAEHYDETERIVGTWFGETLYQKTLVYSDHFYGNVDKDVSALNIDKVVEISGMMGPNNVYNYSVPIAYAREDSQNDVAVLYSDQNKLLQVRIGSTYTSGNYFDGAYITLKYTKTTS